MTVFNWISLGLIVLGWAFTIGKFMQRTNEQDKVIRRLDNDVNNLKTWGETEIARQIAYRESHYVSLDRYNDCVGDIKRRLDEVNTIEAALGIAPRTSELRKEAKQSTERGVRE